MVPVSFWMKFEINSRDAPCRLSKSGSPTLPVKFGSKFGEHSLFECLPDSGHQIEIIMQVVVRIQD
jgi:hypothetical protein